MTYRFLFMAICLGFNFHVPRVLASDEHPQVSLGEFIVQMPALTTRPLMDYCTSEQPELREELEGKYKNFLEKLLEAGRPLSESFSSDPDFLSPVPEKLENQVKQVSEMMLAEVKRVDSNAYCNTIITRMSEATVGQLRVQINQSYEGYRQHARDTHAGEGQPAN